MVLHCHYLNYPVHPLQSSMQQMSIVYFYNHKHYLSAIFTACLDKEQLLDGRLPFCHGPAHVAQWSKHSGTTCSRVWSAQWLGFKPQPWHVRLLKNYCLSNAFIAFERLSNHFGVCACVCVCVCLLADRLSNDYVRNSLPIFTKFCMWLGNLVGSTPIVCETNRK